MNTQLLTNHLLLILLMSKN